MHLNDYAILARISHGDELNGGGVLSRVYSIEHDQSTQEHTEPTVLLGDERMTE